MQNWPGKQKNTGYFANLLLLKWVVLHLSMVFSLSEHVCQLAFVRAREKKGETREKERESLVPADAHLPQRRDKSENESVEGVTITLFCFHLICSPHLCGRYKSVELQSCCNATLTATSRAVKWGRKKSNSKETKTSAVWARTCPDGGVTICGWWLLCKQALITPCKPFFKYNFKPC